MNRGNSSKIEYNYPMHYVLAVTSASNHKSEIGCSYSCSCRIHTRKRTHIGDYGSIKRRDSESTLDKNIPGSSTITVPGNKPLKSNLDLLVCGSTGTVVDPLVPALLVDLWELWL